MQALDPKATPGLIRVGFEGVECPLELLVNVAGETIELLFGADRVDDPSTV